MSFKRLWVERKEL